MKGYLGGKVKNIFFALMFSFFLIGCGGGGGDSDNNSQAPIVKNENSITIVDGYIKGAIVKDSDGNIANYKGDGVYEFNTKPQGTIYVFDGEFEDSNVKNNFDYEVDAKHKIISPLTHFTSKYPKKKDQMLKALEISEEDLNKDFIEELKNDNDKFENVAKAAQIFYALETNYLLEDLKEFSSYHNMLNDALQLAIDKPEAEELIIAADKMSADELIKAETALAKIKVKVNNNADKKSGIRLEGVWKAEFLTSNCPNKSGKGYMVFLYDKNAKEYTIFDVVGQTLYPNNCSEKKYNISDFENALKKKEDLSKLIQHSNNKVEYFRDVRYPLPISEFNKSIELSKLLSSIEADESLHSVGQGLKLLSPDKFINKSKMKFGDAEAIYTRILK